MFQALVVDNNGGTVTASMQTANEASLPAGNVLVGVEYSTVNYKDGLVVTGAGGLVKRYPHVPGIDFAGTVLESAHPAHHPGDKKGARFRGSCPRSRCRARGDNASPSLRRRSRPSHPCS